MIKGFFLGGLAALSLIGIAAYVGGAGAGAFIPLLFLVGVLIPSR